MKWFKFKVNFFSFQNIMIGPHVNKEGVWDYDICQVFIHSPQSYVNSSNIGGLIKKFPKKDINYK